MKTFKSFENTWRQDDLRRAFLAGVRWWEMERAGSTPWAGDRAKAEAEAERRRYPKGRLARRPRGRET